MATDYTVQLADTYDIDKVKIIDIEGSYNNLFTAIDENGEVWRWTFKGTPVKIPKEKFDNLKVIKSSNGNNHSLFITEDGNVWSIGVNSYGKLGDGTKEDKTDPVKVLNVSNAVWVSAGNKHSIAVDGDGRVWAWGYAAYGSLGNNFSLSRSKISTAAGNELPTMTITEDIKTRYFSKNSKNIDKRNITLSGSVAEKDKEKTTVSAAMLGLKKSAVIEAEEYTVDIYDKVVPVRFTVSWPVSEIEEGMNFQSLTKVVAEDDRGGLIEQFFAGRYIVDNDIPQKATIGGIYTVSGESETVLEPETSKYVSLDKAIRVYFNTTQKIGDNKAPVKVQYQSRKREPWGYSMWEDENDLSTWTTVEGNYHDFFTGYAGEHEIRIRAVDEAENTSDIFENTIKIVVGDAGPEITKLKAEPLYESNVLGVKLTFESFSKSTRKTYGVKRKSMYDTGYENLTIERETLTEGEIIFTDRKGGLKGNTEYTYLVDGENNVGIGVGSEVKVITYPYMPIDVIKKVSEDNKNVSILLKQDTENSGEIEYKLAIIERTGTQKVYTEIVKSSNMIEGIMFELTPEKLGFDIVNNQIDIRILFRGINEEWNELVYGENIIIEPNIGDVDKEGPRVEFRINNGAMKVASSETSKISFQLAAVDNKTAITRLKTQISEDGINWYGKNDILNAWEKNKFSDYKTEYKNYEFKEGTGRKTVYVRVRDEDGNYGYAFSEIYVLGEEDRASFTPNVSGGVTDKFTNSGGIGSSNTSSGETELNIESGSDFGVEYVYLNASQVQIKISDYFEIDTSKEVQYSLNGVKWSDWEPGMYFKDKMITLDNDDGDGLKTINIRQRNVAGIISNAKSISFMLDTTSPVVRIKSSDMTYIAVDGNINLEVEITDNMVEDVKFTVIVQTYNAATKTYSEIINLDGSTGGKMISVARLRDLPAGKIKFTVVAEDGSKNETRVSRLIWSKN